MKTDMPTQTSPGEQNESDMQDGKMHVQDLMRAHEIMNNPEKMAKVHKVIGHQASAVTAIKSLGDLKARATKNAMAKKAPQPAAEPAPPEGGLQALKGGM